MRIICIALAVSLGVGALASPGDHIIHSTRMAPIRCHVMNTLLFRNQIDRSLGHAPKEHEQPIPPIKFNTNVGSPISGPLGKSDLKESLKKGVLYPGIGPTGWVPPDPNIACGPSYLVETVNDHVAFFNKSNGTNVFEQSFGNFFASINPGNFLFDPKAMYDKVSGKFIILADNQDGNTAFIDIAISQTSNPNGKWNMYKVNAQNFSGGTNFWLDYPSLACSSTGVVITGNMFPLGNGGFGGVQFIVLPKAQMLAGTTLTPSSLLDPSEGSAQVARNWETNQTTIYGLDLNGTALMRVYAIENPSATPTLQYVDVAMPTFTYPQQDAVSRDGHDLDTLGDRILNVYQRNGHLMCGHSVQASSGDRPRSVARWEMFSINGWPASGQQPSYLQGGDIDTGANDDDIQPAIDENYLGDVSVCFTRCSPTIVDDIMYTGRKAADPAGSTSTPQVLIGSNTDYGGTGYNRWGDFFDVSIDPIDDSTFWGIGEIADQNGNWQTYFFNWQITKSSSLANVYNPTSIIVKEGQYVSGQVSDVDKEDNNFYVAQSRLVPGYSAVDVNLMYNVGNISALSQMQLNVDAQFAGKPVTRMVYAYNYVNRVFTLLSTTSGTQTGELTIPLPNFQQYVNNGQMAVIVRGVISSRKGGAPFLFNLSINQAVVEGG